MKKFLSLVLALVMTMSLVTVSAGAKDFGDSDKIQYKEAVDVMSAVKVIDGYTDGTFNPSNTLTRGAAAKIICNLILGPTTAKALVADAAPYKDVPTNHTFAGYIAYCQKEGIISGYADGTFRPANSLTGYAFMKMLLGALGYDAAVEGYTGPNWSINVAKRALSDAVDLADGLVDNFNGVKAVNREEACLYALNTLKADMVEYDAKTSVTAGNTTVVIAGSKAKEMENKNKNTDGNVYGKDEIMQFAEKYFTDLSVKTVEDDFGRPSNMWKIKAEEVGTYTTTPDQTYTKKVEAGDIYKDLGLGSTVKADDVTVYVNGVEKTAAEVDIKKGSETKIGESGNGVLTEVYYQKDADTIVIAQTITYFGEISKTVKATDKKDAYIVVATSVDGSNKPAGAQGTEEFETDEKFADEAKVLYTYSERDGVEEIKSVELAKEVTGTVTKVKNDSKDESNSGLTLAGTEYKAANIMAKSLLSAISVNLDYTAYIDAYGYVISVSEEDYKDYALVLEIEGEYEAGFNTNRAKLLFTDGTTSTVNLAKDYKNKGVAQNEIVTYKADNGVYTLKEVKKTQKSVDVTNFVMENGKATINTNTGDVNSVATVYGNSKTMFVVKNVADRDYTAYTGIKNAPTVKSAAITGGKVSAYWYCKSGDIVTAMFVLPESDLQVTDENNNLLFLAKESVSKLIHDSVGDYYEYQAVVNGKIETVKVDWKVVKDSTVQTTEESGKLNGLFSKYSKDKDGIITNLTTYTTTPSTTSKYAGAGVGSDRNSADYTVIVKNGTDAGSRVTPVNYGTWTVADDAKFFEIDKDGKITDGVYASVTKDDDDRLYFVIDDGQIAYMFVETVTKAITSDGKVPVDPETKLDTLLTGSKAEIKVGTVGVNGRMNLSIAYTAPDFAADGAVTLDLDVYDNKDAFVQTITATGTVKNGKATVSYRSPVSGEFDTGVAYSLKIADEKLGAVKVQYVDAKGNDVTGYLKSGYTKTLTTGAETANNFTFTFDNTKYNATADLSYTISGLNVTDGTLDGTLKVDGTAETATAGVNAKGNDYVKVVIALTGVDAVDYVIAGTAATIVTNPSINYTGSYLTKTTGTEDKVVVTPSRTAAPAGKETAVNVTVALKDNGGSDKTLTAAQAVKVTVSDGTTTKTGIVMAGGKSVTITGFTVSKDTTFKVVAIEDLTAPTAVGVVSVTGVDADLNGKWDANEKITVKFDGEVENVVDATGTITASNIAVATDKKSVTFDLNAAPSSTTDTVKITVTTKDASTGLTTDKTWTITVSNAAGAVDAGLKAV